MSSIDSTSFLKFCGFTLAEDAEAALEAGVDALGFNFWPKSKRYLSPGRAASLLPQFAGRTLRVGVFVNTEPMDVRRLFAVNWIDVAQFHGDETPEYCQDFADAGLPFFKALGVKDESSLENLDQWHTPFILLDAWQPEAYGGSGRIFNWELARLAVERYPDLRFILSGGLTPENVAEAVKASNVAGVDTASGIEQAPGIKDEAKMAAFAKNYRG